jgi:hypothetical protein
MQLILASEVILGPECRGAHDHILLALIRDSPHVEGQVPVFMSHRNRVMQLYPNALGCLFIASNDSRGYSGGIRIASTWGLNSIQVQVNLRLMVSRPVFLGVGLPSEAYGQFFFLFSVWQLRFSWCGAPSLTIGWVCNLLVQLLLGIVEVPQNSMTIFWCIIWDSPNLEGQVPVFLSPRNRVSQLYSWALGSLLSPLTTRRATVKVFLPASTRVWTLFKVILPPMVSQPVCLGLMYPSGTRDQFFLFYL